MVKRVAILQSNYIPWKGYFDMIHDADDFVFLDDVQYTRQDWRNRNVLKTDRGPAWLTIPVGTSLRRRICDVRLPHGWAAQHWREIERWYGEAPYFSHYAGLIGSIYRSGFETLSAFNQHMIRVISSEVLGIATRFHDSRSFDAAGSGETRVLGIVRQLGGTDYISGPAARAYLNPDHFIDAGITVTWKDYAGYPEYPQFHAPFCHTVTILDLLFHTGPEAPWYIWGWRTRE